jgi:hypothetical protein
MKYTGLRNTIPLLSATYSADATLLESGDGGKKRVSNALMAVGA